MQPAAMVVAGIRTGEIVVGNGEAVQVYNVVGVLIYSDRLHGEEHTPVP